MCICHPGDVTHISQLVVNLVPHLGHPPLDDVAEVFIVDIVVLLAHRALSALFELVLTVPGNLQ